MSSEKDHPLEAEENQWNWQKFKTNVVKASDASPDSNTRGRTILDAIYKGFRKLDGITHRYIPEQFHPFVQAGAIANFMFVVAVLTGFALLIWYNPSVHEAYDTVTAMGEKPFTAGLIRSLHRYSSDVFILFVIFHALKVFFGVRFTGSRWLAWVTGVIGLLLIWFDGWLGYWLVWDDRGAMIATATAKMVDVLPIFAEPLKASFLTGDSFNSVLFLIVFFMHMLIPIAFGIAIWLHVSRLNKPGFFTNFRFSMLLLASLIIVSLIFPADIAGRADLLTTPEKVTADYFYLFALILTERLQGGTLWLISLIAFVSITGIPWFMKRRKKDTQPIIDEYKCNGCEQCFYDCPYNAISMVPREKGNMKKSEFVAEIDYSICVSCGICIGSCDPVAIEYPNLSPWEIRRKLDNWLDKDQALENLNIAFVCGNSAGSSLTINSETGECKEMPGYLVFTLPCAGWIHPSLIERSLKKGADGVLVMGCESDPDFRLGADWMGDRIEGERHPEFRKDRYETDRVLYLKLDKPEMKKFLSEAQKFRRIREDKKQRIRNIPVWKQVSIGLIVALGLAAFTIWPSSLDVPLPNKASELVISFKKEGAPVYSTPQDNENLPKHMQRKSNKQQVAYRSSVAVKVSNTAGNILFEEQFEPKGVFSRGYSSGLIEIPLNSGSQTIKVQFGDVLEDGIDWKRSEEKALNIYEGERVVLRFSEQAGYHWYIPEREPTSKP